MGNLCSTESVPILVETALQECSGHLRFSGEYSFRSLRRLHSGSHAERGSTLLFSPVHANFRTVSVDDHALFYFIIAGDDQFIFALQFDHAYTAGADLVDIFK